MDAYTAGHTRSIDSRIAAQVEAQRVAVEAQRVQVQQGVAQRLGEVILTQDMA